MLSSRNLSSFLPTELRPIHFLFLLSLPVCFLLVRSISQAYFTTLRSVPGPALAKFSRLWYLSNVYRGDFEKVNARLHEQYGPIVRIAPNECSVDDPEALKGIYGHGTKFVKAPWYHAAGSPNAWDRDIFSERDPKRHAEIRRKLASLYSMSSLLRAESYVSESSEVLLRRFGQLADRGTTIDLQLWMQFFAFDVIALITLDKSFGFVESGTDSHGLLDALHSYLVYCANVGVYSEWHWHIRKAMSFLPAKGSAFLGDFCRTQIKARKAESTTEKASKTRNDFLSQLFDMHETSPRTITEMDIFVACLTNIGAGSDTTSISLSSILYQVYSNPEKLRMLRTEVDERSRRGELSQHPSFSESQAMPYLQACIKEGLRMHPATGLPLARVVPKGGITIAGQYLGEGTVVGTNSWISNYNRDVFGDDAASFEPERWLESSERLSAMERNFLTFGAGSRTCIGKNISLMEISKIVPMLVREFDFEFVGIGEAGVQTFNCWFVKQTGLNCRLSRRLR